MPLDDHGLELVRTGGTSAESLYENLTNGKLHPVFDIYCVPENKIDQSARIISGISPNEEPDRATQRILKDCEDIRSNLSKIEGLYRSLLKQERSIIAQSAELANTYLPDEATIGNPLVVLLPTGRDGRVLDGVVYLDPRLLVELSLDELVRLIGHEFHHVGRGQIRPFSVRANPDFEAYVVSCMESLELEGIADLVSEITEFKAFDSFREKRRCIFEDYARYLEQYQEAVVKRYCDPAERSLSMKEISSAFYKEGQMHPVGHRMATEIQREMGKDELVACVGDPFEFLRCYQITAKRRGLFVFGERYISIMNSLEKKERSSE